MGGAGFKLGDSLLKKGGQIAGKFLGTAGKEAAAKAGGSVVQKGLKECFKTGFKCGVGATTYDIASQVASGKGLTDIDWKEVGASAAIGLGLGMGAKALSNSKVGQKVDETQVKIGEKLKSTGVKSLEKAGDKLVGDYHDSGSGNPGAGKTSSNSETESSSGASNKYYQATSKKTAQELMQSPSPTLKGREFKQVYAWGKQPTIEQAKNSGARNYETVIEFETNASFSKDSTVS